MATKRTTKRTTKKKKKKTTSKKSKALPFILAGGSLGLLVAGIIIFSILIGVLFNFHFLMTKDGFKMVEKNHWGMNDTFADTRDWGFVDWANHPDVGQALLADELDKGMKKLFE